MKDVSKLKMMAPSDRVKQPDEIEFEKALVAQEERRRAEEVAKHPKKKKSKKKPSVLPDAEKPGPKKPGPKKKAKPTPVPPPPPPKFPELPPIPKEPPQELGVSRPKPTVANCPSYISEREKNPLIKDLADFITDKNNLIYNALLNPFEADNWKRKPLVGMFIRLFLQKFGPAYPYLMFRVWRRIKGKVQCRESSYDQFRIVICRLKTIGLIRVNPDLKMGRRSFYDFVLGDDALENMTHFGWVNPQVAYGKRFEWVPVDGKAGKTVRVLVDVGDVKDRKNVFIEMKRQKWLEVEDLQEKHLHKVFEPKTFEDINKKIGALKLRIRRYRGEEDVSMPEKPSKGRKHK